MTRGLDDNEEKLVERLKNTGIKKNAAKALVYIASNGETKCRDMEADMRLRQPEVSIAVKELREKGWVGTEKEKKEGKGRPVHIYSLNKPFKEIIESIEEEERKRLEERKDKLKKAKELAEEEFEKSPSRF